MIIGIDPSFSRTGIAVMDGDSVIFKTVIVSGIPVYETIVTCQQAAQAILDGVSKVISEYPGSDVIYEYPALATRSGAYLAVLLGYLTNYLNNSPLVKSVTYVPPTACDSFTKNKAHSKSFLVEWCRSHGYITKRTTHDECTAIIFCVLLKAIWEKKYKNSWFVYPK